MRYGMTAFSNAQKTVDNIEFTWVLRSVNHRYKEINFFIPKDLYKLEESMREIIAKKISRGKIDCNLSLSFNDRIKNNVQIDTEKLQDFLNESDRLSKLYNLANDVSFVKLLPYIMTDGENINKDLLELEAMSLLNIAVDKLLACKSQEGLNIERLLQEKLLNLENLLQDIKNLKLDSIDKKLENLKLKAQQILDGVNAARLDQELAFLLMRCDITEEVERLDMHIADLKNTLLLQEPIGKKLDFLMQELLRETNTIASKSDNKIISSKTVDLKVCIEQMREQIQNIE